MIDRRLYEDLFATRDGKRVLEDILQRLGYHDPIGRTDPRAEIRAVALHDFAVELVDLTTRKQEKPDEEH